MKKNVHLSRLGKKYLPWLIFILGILLRCVYLGQVPGGYHRDEAYGAWNAFALFHDGIDSSGHSYPVYFEVWAHGQSALNTYLMLPFIALFGGHVTPLAVRIPQAIVSVGTLAAVYVLLKKICSQKTATWGLFLLAICPWHVMMSRWGLDANLAPGFLIFGLCFFVLGMDKPPWLVASALCYGLSLYCYAVIWPVVPVILILQIAYGIWAGKIHWDRWLLLSGLILIMLALPLILFLGVNMGYLPELTFGPFSIYRMSEFRSGELAHSLSQIWDNIKQTGYLLKRQNVRQPYDLIMPYGFFYDLGRLFILLGVPVVILRTLNSFRKREFAWEWFLLVQLVGAGMVGCLVSVNMTQLNCLYIPLVLCEAVGVQWLIQTGKAFFTKKRGEKTGRILGEALTVVLAVAYLVNLAGFQKAYYTDYKELVSAWFQEEAHNAVKYALGQAAARNMDVSVNAGLKYPNVLLSTETTAREYLDTLVYSDFRPAPSQFTKEGVTFYMGFDYDSISRQQVYVLYYTDIEYFEDFELEAFSDWYVALPK